ncbi:MAG: hypothetical protein K2I03_09345 [Lachnospiraceae bacterium]|nr:hypothetical protein [Lachnospiraceae bacterium]MDE5781662.1 hypothetical protein [Lachnospiraceae bacterium]MDE6253217.1 hypothetical protein [Lachnospiraceae bacterium]
MKYYILKQDKDYTDAPVISNWFGRIDTDNIRPGKYKNLKEMYSLTIRDNKELYPVDFIMEPFPAVSAMVEHCIRVYEPNIGCSRLYLLEKTTGRAEEYFIPYLTEEDCLAESSIVNRNRTVIEKPVIDINKVSRDRYIFLIGNMNSRYVVVREEFMESILRRGARGISLIPVELEK